MDLSISWTWVSSKRRATSEVISFLLIGGLQFLGGSRDLQMLLIILLMQAQWWGCHEVVGTLLPYHIQKNLFDLHSQAAGDSKTSGDH